jgi:hypothetical protein
MRAAGAGLGDREAFLTLNPFLALLVEAPTKRVADRSA